MTVQLDGDRIRIVGPGVIEDAELLLTLLQSCSPSDRLSLDRRVIPSCRNG